MFPNWRLCTFIGVTSAVGSICWFTAFALENASYVRSVGQVEAIFTLLMLQENFIAASANIQELDEGAAGIPIVTDRIDNIEMQRVMSNSFGFGGTNASLVFQRYQD